MTDLKEFEFYAILASLNQQGRTSHEPGTAPNATNENSKT